MNSLKKHLYNPQTILLSFLVLLVTISGVLWILTPPPPKTIKMAAGMPEGLYYQFGERLKSELAKEGVTLELVETAGTVENLRLLSGPKSDIDFAMMQSGVADANHYPNLVSIAGLFYEPVWVWYRASAFKADGGQLRILSQLKGKRVSVGNQGSGTAALTTALLDASEIKADEIKAEYLTPDEALSKLNAGTLDVAFIVVAAEAPVLKNFYNDPDIRLMYFDQADAYVHNLTYLSKVNVPRGLLGIARDIPRESTQVLAPTATLVAKADISPALLSLVLGATYDILPRYSLLQKPGEFPSSKGLTFPLHSDAEIYLKDGPSFLHRHLPFWSAVWVARFIKIVIPLLVIFIPLFTYLSSANTFLLRLKFAGIYEELYLLEQNASNLAMREQNFKELELIEQRVANMKVSALAARDFYDLKGHIGEVRNRLKLLT
jgi:TRAP transporter TAXI family solute receptor